jgi:hypothetical protein
MIDATEDAMRDLFSHLGNFDRHWAEGWRPVLEDNGDILFRSPLKNYVRSRKDEHGHRFAFHFLWGQLLFPGHDAPREEPSERS